MKNLKSKIEGYLKKRNFTKEVIINEIGMTRQGFDYSLKNETLKVNELDIILKLLAIEPNDFFEYKKNIAYDILSEPEVNYGYLKKSDTKIDTISEVDYLRNQNDKLLRIIENFSIKTDTKNIKN